MASDLSPAAAWHLAHRGDEPSFVAQAEAVLARIPPGDEPVLDVGCGSAPLGERLVRAGHSLVGVDRDEAMLRAARLRVPGAAAILAAADALPFPSGVFKAVTALGLFEYLRDPAAALAEFARVLRPGGSALLTVPRREAGYRRGLALAAPLLRAAGRADPFDLRSGRALSPTDAVAWTRVSGLALLVARPVAPAILPWPLDRALPGLAARLAARAGDGAGTSWFFGFGKIGEDRP